MTDTASEDAMRLTKVEREYQEASESDSPPKVADDDSGYCPYWLGVGCCDKCGKLGQMKAEDKREGG